MSRFIAVIGGLAALTVAIADIPEGIDSWQPWTTVAAIVAVAAVLWRSQCRPYGVAVALAAIAAVSIGAEIVGEAGQIPFGHVLVIGVLVADAARWSPRLHVLAVLGGAAVVALLSEGLASGREWSEAALAISLWGMAASAGFAVRFWKQGLLDRAERTRVVERERIARELHDVVAHHVSAIAMTAEGARSIVTADPAQADRSLVAIHAAASTTLDEMRRMVAILRDGDQTLSASTEVPQRLADLADAFAETGHQTGHPPVTVHLDVATEPSAAVRAALFRIAQEAVTNARRHAQGATRIEVHLASDAVTVALAIRDDGQPTGRRPHDAGFGLQGFGLQGLELQGFGLRGMRERAELLGGTFRAGPANGGGWEVHADLPLKPNL